MSPVRRLACRSGHSSVRGLSVLTVLMLSITMMVSCTKRTKDVTVDLPSGEKLTLPVGETLRINVTSEPPTLDWHRATDTTSSQIGTNIMEGLVEYDLSNKDLGLKPALATKWVSSEKARKWKITLRDGVVWNDGQPFTPQHVLDGWQRLLAKETASEYSYFLFALKNGRAFNEGKVGFNKVGAKVTGPNEISVELERPMSYFPYLLTHYSTYPIRLDAVKKGGDRWTEPGNIITLGPFNLKAWAHDKQIVLERNEKYYGEKPSIKYVLAYMIPEQATAINLFDSGKLDSVHRLPSVELRKLRERKEFQQTGSLMLQYYGYNVTKPPMDNPLVRKALAAAVDRQQIAQMLAGGQLPMTSWVPSGMPGYEPERGIPFDPEKARSYLREAGYAVPAIGGQSATPGKPFPKVELRFNTNEDHQRVAENFQAQIKKNLGIDIELRNEEWKVYLNNLKTDPPHIWRLGWVADYPDPDNFLNLITSYSENNRTRWKNKRYDALVEKGAGTTSPEERKKIYNDAQKILVEDDAPVIPLYSGVNHMLISPRVENYPVNAIDRFLYKGVKLK